MPTSEPNMYLIEMRKRGNKVRVYSGNSNTLRFTVNILSGGYCGVQSDGPIKCCFDWVMKPFVVMPDGSTSSFGRISRSGVTWDAEFKYSLASDEAARRSMVLSAAC